MARQDASAALLEQSDLLLEWVAALPVAAYERPTVLPGWDVRQLLGHLALVHEGLTQALERPGLGTPEPLSELVRRYRRDVDEVTAATVEASQGRTGPQVAARLRASVEALAARLARGGVSP